LNLLTYPWAGFEDANVSVVVNPDKTGNNLSNKVVKRKPSGAQVYAGASLNLDSKVDFSKGTKVKVNVWSPKVERKYYLKRKCQHHRKMEMETQPFCRG
jgi:hypothetical protein